MNPALAINAFLRLYLGDLGQRHVKTLEEYQALYPGFESEIACEFARMESEGAPDPRGSLEREQFGHYRLIEEIGRGGQGVVWLAEDTRLPRRVALKILAAPAAVSPDLVRRFRREATLAAKLDLPGLCPIYEAGLEDGVPYIAMRYLDGQTLASRIAEEVRLSSVRPDSETLPDGSMPRVHRSATSATQSSRERVLLAIVLVEQVARTLHAAHEAGIVHRDIKPGNIMITNTGEPVILDLGLARDLDAAQPTLTGTGDLLGTPAYMAPELIQGRTLTPDRRADVWSLGVTLYQALTLRRPFDAPTREGLYRAILNEEPKDPRAWNGAIPIDLVAVLGAVLEKDLGRRYQTALDLAEDLRRVREHEPVSARPVTLRVRCVRWVRRHPARAALLAVASVSLVALASMGGYLAARQPEIDKARRIDREERIEEALREGFFLDLPEGGASAASVAAAAFSRALELDPTNAEAVAGVAMILLRGPRGATEALSYLNQHGSAEREHPELEIVRDEILRVGQLRPKSPETFRPAPTTALGLHLQSMMDARNAKTGDRAAWLRVQKMILQAIMLRGNTRPMLYESLSEAVDETEDASLAAACAWTLTKNWPRSAVAWYWAGWALQKSAPKDAEAAFQRSEELRPGSIRTLCSLANLLQRQTDYGRAREVLDRALAIAPTHPFLLNSLGLLLRQIGDRDGAIQQFRLAVERTPDRPVPLYNLSLMLLEAEDWSGATEVLHELLKLKRDDFDSWLNLGAAARKLGDPAIAEDAFRKAIGVQPTHFKGHANLAFLLEDRGRQEEALAAYAVAMNCEGAPAGLHEEYVKALRKSGEIEALRSELERWASLHSKDAAAWAALAEHQVRTARREDGDKAAAVATAARTVELTSGRDARALQLLALAWFEAGAEEQAVVVAERALAVAREADTKDPALVESIQRSLTRFKAAARD